MTVNMLLAELALKMELARMDIEYAIGRTHIEDATGKNGNCTTSEPVAITTFFVVICDVVPVIDATSTISLSKKKSFNKHDR